MWLIAGIPFIFLVVWHAYSFCWGLDCQPIRYNSVNLHTYIKYVSPSKHFSVHSKKDCWGSRMGVFSRVLGSLGVLHLALFNTRALLLNRCVFARPVSDWSVARALPVKGPLVAKSSVLIRPCSLTSKCTLYNQEPSEPSEPSPFVICTEWCSMMRSFGRASENCRAA